MGIPNSNPLAKKVAAFRAERGLNLKEMADEIGISFSYLSAIEREVKKPSLEVVRKLAAAMNVPASYLFSEPAKSTSVGAKLRLIREGRGITLVDLAEFSGLDLDYLTALEAGTTQPTLAEMEILAEVLDVTPQYFIQDSSSNVSIGKRISNARTNRGWSQYELATKVDISTSLLSQVENDKAVPSLETLEKIAEALDLSVCYFLLDQEEVFTLLSSLSPDALELLKDPRTQAILRAVRDLDKGELKFILNQITFFKKSLQLLR